MAATGAISRGLGILIVLVGAVILGGPVALKRLDRITPTVALYGAFAGIVLTAFGAILFDALSPTPHAPRVRSRSQKSQFSQRVSRSPALLALRRFRFTLGSLFLIGSVLLFTGSLIYSLQAARRLDQSTLIVPAD